jgi:hypothetical protein
MSGYTACCLYRSLKLHFTSGYDYFYYHGRVSYSEERFSINQHITTYNKIGKLYSDEEQRDLFISNFIVNKNLWVRDMLSIEAQEIYKDFKKRKQSLSYIFENDVINMFMDEDPEQLFKYEEGNMPLIIKKMLRKDICMETVVIMDDFMDFIGKYDKIIKDDLVWADISMNLVKYKPFVKYDKVKLKGILKKIVNNCI